ncbi:hypothetical protein [Halobacillus litoralis]|nr:hypothetical protein [Halobacillus litoralis]
MELRPISKEDLNHLFKWSDDEEPADLGHRSASAYQNITPIDLEAFWKEG